LKLCKNKNFRLVGGQTAAARNDVTAKKLLADCFKTFSGLPEDWTVSGPCHLYSTWHDIAFRFAYSFTFDTRFSSGEDRRCSNPKFTVFSNLWSLLWFCWCHTKTGTSKLWDVITQTDPWLTSGSLSRGATSRPRLANLFGTSWSRGRTIIDGISRFGEVAWHSVLYEFPSSALCREVSRYELFAKSHLCRLYLRLHFSSHCPGFLRWRSEQRIKTDSFMVFESWYFVTTER